MKTSWEKLFLPSQKQIDFGKPSYNYRKRRKSQSILLLPLLAFLGVGRERSSRLSELVENVSFAGELVSVVRSRPKTRQRRQISPELVNVKNLRFGEFELWRNRRKDKDALGLIIQGYNSILPIKILMVKLTKV